MNKKAIVYITMSLMFSIAVFVILMREITDSDRVNAVAYGIADFDLPTGYETDYVIDALDYTIAAYKSADEQSHLAFVQMPPGIMPDEAAMSGYIPNVIRDENWQAASLISTDQLTVCEQPAILTISERRNGEGVLYRNANLVFQGQEGPALLVINQPATGWNRDLVDHFIASIRLRSAS